MKRIYTSILAAAMVLMLAASAMANGGQMVRKLDSFDFLVDYSGSMMMKHKQLGTNKMEMAKTVLNRVNSQIPTLGYEGSMHTFAPISTMLERATYEPSSMGAAIDALDANQEIYGRLTPMGQNMADLNPMINEMPRKAGVILVTDGESNIGIDPVEEARLLYANNPGLVIHAISLADSAKGQAAIDAIIAMNPDSVSVMASDLLTDDAAVAKFVEDVFYTYGDAIVLRSVNFALNSSVITEESAVILDEVAVMLQNNRGIIEVAGHTCSLGTEQYNQGLSERRAASVKAYLVKHGVPADTLQTVGYGETRPKYDNSTDQGRRLNRRVELNRVN